MHNIEYDSSGIIVPGNEWFDKRKLEFVLLVTPDYWFDLNRTEFVSLLPGKACFYCKRSVSVSLLSQVRILGNAPVVASTSCSVLYLSSESSTLRSTRVITYRLVWYQGSDSGKWYVRLGHVRMGFIVPENEWFYKKLLWLVLFVAPDFGFD